MRLSLDSEPRVQLRWKIRTPSILIVSGFYSKWKKNFDEVVPTNGGGTMKSLEESQEFQVTLLESLIDPRVACSGKLERARASPTKIKALYHLYQLQKNVTSGKWKSIYQGKTAISESAQISKNHFSEFVNSPDFHLFGEVTHRPGTTNIYKLQEWVIQTFVFLERTGMMKNFRQNFADWRDKFLARLHKWLLPLLRKGYALAQILMNKISTKQKLKGDDLKPLKGGGIKPSGSSYQAFQGSKSNTEPPDPILSGFVEAFGTLRDRFCIKEGDLYWIKENIPLKNIKKAIIVGQEWLKNGIEIRSPIRMFMGAMKKACSSSARV
jgi:hypothetical protein